MITILAASQNWPEKNMGDDSWESGRLRCEADDDESCSSSCVTIATIMGKEIVPSGVLCG